MIKPNKIVYENQKEIHDLIVRELKSKYFNGVKEAYLIGSLVNGNFGKYAEKHEGYYGSDVDVVIIPAEIQKSWKYEGDFYDWHKRYLAGEIIINRTAHPINFMVPFNSDINLFSQKVKELNWKVEELK